MAAESLAAQFPDTTAVRTELYNLLSQAEKQPTLSTAWHWTILTSIADLVSSLPGQLDPLGLDLAREFVIENNPNVQDQVSSVGLALRSLLASSIDTETFVATLNEKPVAQEHCRTLNVFEQQIKTARSRTKTMLANDLLSQGQHQHLQLLGVVLKKLSPEDVSGLEAEKQFLIHLCKVMDGATAIGQFGAATACVSFMLRQKTFLVGQHAFDTLLSTISTLCSTQAPALPREHSGFIFDRLCQLTTTLILLHRRRIGGRMHLLVSLIQNLMSCLFNPHRYQVSALSAQPSWLSSLTVNHAVAYTRVLTTLCSPTVSSTHSHRGPRMADAGLVDEAKRAKEYAGQYVSYVLLHYCTLQLQGSVTPEIGEKLKIGLWAMMEVVDIEAMRGMNAGMGREERVVWGALYAEWNRTGRFRLN